jgi:16S rRNA (uracil1498-N3)-methyltransferase
VLPRLYVGEGSLSEAAGSLLDLADGPSRHIQVLRLQPGDAVQLFDGAGLERAATVSGMGRKVVQVELGAPVANARELPVRVTLAIGMPANDRMDALVEKACELGVHEIQPLVCARSVLRLDGERAAKKVAHWQAVAVSACEQSGRAVVPRVKPVMGLAAWVQAQGAGEAAAAALSKAQPGETAMGEFHAVSMVHRGVLSLREAVSIGQWLEASDSACAHAQAQDQAQHHAQQGTVAARQWVFLSGPEGGLAPEEEALALSLGWTAVSLGARVLRADTAPLAALSVIGARYEA